jgi:glycogen debranching enzyme
MKNGKSKQISINTISSLLPLMLDIPTDIKDRLIEHLLDKTEYWSNYPIPTVSMTEKMFDPTDKKLLWRGPTWINTNFFIWLGLKKHKEYKIADKIAKKSVELVQKSGYREFYNPITGIGGGAKNFGWSTLVIIMKESN